MRIEFQDRHGVEVSADAQVFVWMPARRVIAVDLDCLPPPGHPHVAQARAAMNILARDVNFLYLTSKAVIEHARARRAIKDAGYPGGPLVVWRSKSWHFVSRGRFRLPQVVIERQLVSRLPQLRKEFPGLNTGLCTCGRAGENFAEAGIRTVVIGAAEVDGDVPDVTRCPTWLELPAKLGL